MQQNEASGPSTGPQYATEGTTQMTSPSPRRFTELLEELRLEMEKSIGDNKTYLTARDEYSTRIERQRQELHAMRVAYSDLQRRHDVMMQSYEREIERLSTLVKGQKRVQRGPQQLRQQTEGVVGRVQQGVAPQEQATVADVSQVAAAPTQDNAQMEVETKVVNNAQPEGQTIPQETPPTTNNQVSSDPQPRAASEDAASNGENGQTGNQDAVEDRGAAQGGNTQVPKPPAQVVPPPVGQNGQEMQRYGRTASYA